MKNTDFDLGLTPLKLSKNKYFKKELFDKRQIRLKYKKGRIAFGKKQNESPYFLKTREAYRMLVVGLNRTGKTFAIRGLGDRSNRSGFCVVYLPDVKDEFKSSKLPVQKKFRDGLLKGEKASGTHILTFRPSFFKNIRDYNTLAQDNYWYTPSLKDLSELDFMTLLNVDSLTDAQRIAIKEIYEEIKNHEGKISLEVIYDIIEELEDFNETQKGSLRTKFLPLKYSRILDNNEKKGLDFERILKNGFCLALNMEGFDNITRDGVGLPQVFVSIWLRKIISLRRNKKIPPVLFVVDEASRFVPEDGNPSCKKEIMESVDLDARYGINYCFSTQEPDKLPDEIITQCQYLLIPYNADINMMKTLFKLSGVVSWSFNTYGQKCAMLKKKMKKFEWILINRTDTDYTIIKSLAPLSMHAETTM